MRTKKVTTFLIVAVMLLSMFFITACGNSKILDVKPAKDCYINNQVKLSYSNDNYSDLLKNISKLQDAVSYETMSEFSCTVLLVITFSGFSKLIDAYYLATIYHYSDLSNETNTNGYNDLSNKYSVAYNELKKLYAPMAESKYRSIFYGDATDEEIQELVEKMISSDELVELDAEITDIENRFNELSEEEIITTKFDSLYKELVNANNRIAEINGKDNYLEYCYPNIYQRDYTPSQTLEYVSHFNSLLMPTVDAVHDNVQDLTASLTDREISEISYIMNSSFMSALSQKLLDGFYKSLGDDIYSAYKHLMKKGYFYVTDNQNAYKGAFTNCFRSVSEPFMYFGPGYSNISTFVHEFGHYCNFYLNGISDASYELFETQSQGAEWLFISYLKNYLSEKQHKYLVSSSFFNDSYSVLITALVGAFEVEVYKANNLENVDFDSVMNGICNQVFGESLPEYYAQYRTPQNYYRFVVINSPGYYISYSLSMVSSLEIYAISVTSYDEAVKIYRNILNSSDDYVKVLEDNGLFSPFEQDSFELLRQAFAV